MAPTYTESSTFAWPNNTCGLCGAVQTPAGIGLEPTLAEHLDNIVAVGREVWRVLRDGRHVLAELWRRLQLGRGETIIRLACGGQRAKETERWDRPAYEDTGRRPAASRP